MGSDLGEPVDASDKTSRPVRPQSGKIVGCFKHVCNETTCFPGTGDVLQVESLEGFRLFLISNIDPLGNTSSDQTVLRRQGTTSKDTMVKVPSVHMDDKNGERATRG